MPVKQNKQCYDVVILTGSLGGGGTQHAAARIGSGLDERGVSVAVVTFEDDVAYRCTCDVHCLNTPICKKPQLKRLRQSLHAAQALARFCHHHEVKKILAFGDICAFVQYLARTIYGNRAYFVYRMGDNPWLNTTSKVMLGIVRWLCRHADRTIAVSEELAQLLRTRWEAANVSAIPNGVPIPSSAQMQLNPTDRQFMRDGRFTFITVGSLTEQKNHRALIDAFSMMGKEEIAHSKLVIVGKGILQESLEQQIASNDLTESVYLLGWRDDIPALLANADCFVLSSLWEGMPNVILEALAAGLFVIATDCQTGVREVLAPSLEFSHKVEYPCVGEGGILVEFGIEEHIVAQWSQLLSNIAASFGGCLPEINSEYILSSFTSASVLRSWEYLVCNQA